MTQEPINTAMKKSDCEFCGISVFHLKRHIKQVHEKEKSLKTKCNICEASVVHLKRHTLEVHDRRKLFECEHSHQAGGRF